MSGDRPTGERIDDLAALARDRPEALTERLARVPLLEQAELALRLPPREGLELLLHAPKPMRLVRGLPDAEFHLTVREVGPVDALPLVALGSAGQLNHLVDMESWRGDRFDARRCGGWVALLLEAGEPTVRTFMRKADDELLVLLFQGWARVSSVEPEEQDKHGVGETESGSEEGVISPDGYYRFSPLVPEHAYAVRRVAAMLMHDDPDRYRRILWSAANELPSEVEEVALRWRQSRLEERGYPPWDEAIAVYAPPADVRTRAAPMEPERPDALSVPRLPMRVRDTSELLAPALDRLAGGERERVLQEVVALGNRILVADGADTGDTEAHRRAMTKAAGYVRIALSSRGARDGRETADVLQRVPIVELFREGYARAVALQPRARRLVETGWASARPDALEWLDAPIGPRLAGLLRPRPLYFEAARGGGSYRDFRSLAEVDETRVSLEVAEILGRVLVERLGLDLERVSGETASEPPGRRRFSSFFLTALAWSATRDALRCERLPPDVTADFLSNVASRRTASPDAPGRSLAEFIARLRAAGALRPEEAPALEAYGRACLHRLNEECGALDPAAPVDPRFVSCLLL